MAVAIGTGTPTRSIGFGTYVATPVTSASWTITGSNLVIVLKIGTFSAGTPPTVSAVSWSLGSGTAAQIAQVNSGTPNQRQALWVIPAPVAGGGTYTVTLSGAGTYQITASYFTGADQTTPGTDPWTDGANGQAASVASSVANLTANDACYGGFTCSEANNGATSASPNQLYLDTGGANTIDAVDGYATGTTQVTTVMDVPGVSDVTRAAIRIAAAVTAAVPFVTQLGAMVAGYGKPYSSGFYSLALGASLSLLAAAGPAPFTQTQWDTPASPKPPPITSRTHLQSRPTYYVEPVGAAPFTQHRWPIPSTNRSVLLITTATQPLDTSVISVILPLRLTEFPVPQAKPYPSVLRTWIQARPSWFTEVVPLRQADWTLPRVATPPLDRLTWIQQRLGEPLIPLVPGAPIPQLDWPLPVQAKAPPITARGFIGFYALDDAAPLRAASTMDRPIRSVAAPLTVTWSQGRPILATDAQPFALTAWPLPTRSRDRSVDLLTWIQTRPIFAVDLTPQHLTDWPIMRGRTAPVTSLTWTQSLLGSPLSVPQAGWGPLLALHRNRLVRRAV